MFWANPMVLGIGTMLLSVPIILHFMMQPKPKVFAFPALKFVRQHEVTNRSRMRLRHLLLLILRCLLILLMAAALAGPSVASRQFGQWLIVGGIGFTSLIVAVALAAAYFGAQSTQRELQYVRAHLAAHFFGAAFLPQISALHASAVLKRL